jgi:deoxyadenosine/deoxycytidine kinase
MIRQTNKTSPNYGKMPVYQKPLIVSIEGNIGVGKSTLLSDIEFICQRDHFEIDCLYEPVKKWEDVRDPITNDTMLAKFYREPAKYAFPFQIMAYSTQVQQLMEAITKPDVNKIIITERSLESNHEVFTKMLYDNTMMEDTSYQIYKMNADTHKMSFDDRPNLNTDAYIYLRSSPQTCMDRIRKRDRGGESQITMEYLEDCHYYHESWLNKISPHRCYVLDMDNIMGYDDYRGMFDFIDDVYKNIMMCPPNPPPRLRQP